MPACGSPGLIAACHVLHRLLLPRHPPCALSNLTIKFTSRMRSEERLPAANLQSPFTDPLIDNGSHLFGSPLPSGSRSCNLKVRRLRGKPLALLVYLPTLFSCQTSSLRSGLSTFTGAASAALSIPAQCSRSSSAVSFWLSALRSFSFRSAMMIINIGQATLNLAVRATPKP